MGFANEFLATELELVQRRRRGAVHVLLHQVEHRPGGEALECQQGLGAGLLAHIGNLLHVDQKLLFIDEVVRCLDHFEASGKASQKRMRIVPALAADRKSSAQKQRYLGNAATEVIWSSTAVKPFIPNHGPLQ
ncbi:hypothetical protein D3C86_1708020 [compost metagenome]